jgi:hypothetical protein
MADTSKPAPEQKPIEKQVEEKFVKERIKEIKEFKEKPEKHEFKEKPEKWEHKEKPEKWEHKEKPEKHEFKELRIEKLEIDIFVPNIPIGGPVEGGGPVEERLTALEQALNHFIASGQRPDLSRGALAAERETKK